MRIDKLTGGGSKVPVERAARKGKAIPVYIWGPSKYYILGMHGCVNFFLAKELDIGNCANDRLGDGRRAKGFDNSLISFTCGNGVELFVVQDGG